MAGVATPELAGAVARAGGLGMLCEYDHAPAPPRVDRVLSLASGGAIGMGFFGQWISSDLATFELAAQRLRVVELFWSTPDASLVTRARRAGRALVAWQVGSVADALAAQGVGCDFVVAQGIEAGGHVRGTMPRDALLDAVLASGVVIPVVAAGGLATSAAVARALAAGAAAVRVGTAFVAARESGAHPRYVDALLRARSGDDTVLTTTFGVGWPDAPHRALSSAVAAAKTCDVEVIGETGAADARRPVPRFSAEVPDRLTTGRIEAMALYAGTGVGDVHSVGSASEILADLVGDLD